MSRSAKVRLEVEVEEAAENVIEREAGNNAVIAERLLTARYGLVIYISPRNTVCRVSSFYVLFAST